MAESLEKKLWINVTTGAKENSVKKGDDCLDVRLKSRPVKGRANNELMSVLSDFFGVPKGYIDIIKGSRSKRKLINVKVYDYSLKI